MLTADQNFGEAPPAVETAAPVASPEIAPQPAPSESSQSNATIPSSDSAQATAEQGKTINDALAAFADIGNAAVRLQQKPTDKTATAKPATEPTTSPNEEATQAVERSRRDYSGLTDEEQKIFRSMSAQAFATLKPVYLEHRQLKQQIEELKSQNETTSKATFFEHPESYQLTPEYQAKSQNLHLVENEISFWQRQLSAIRGGQKWTALVGYNQDGSPRYAADLEPSPEAESDVVNAMISAHQIRANLANEVNQIKTTFTTQHKSYLENMEAIEKKIFKEADRAILNKAMEKKLEIFPAHRRGNPEVQMIAKLLAMVDGYALLLNEAKAQGITAAAQTRTLVNGGPPAGTMAAKNGGGKTVNSAIAEFEKAKQAGVY